MYANWSSSQESVVLLSTLLFDTCSFAESNMLVEKFFQCRRNHRIKHIVVGETSSSFNRLRCHKIVNWCRYLNFFDPLCCDLRICCFRTKFSLEFDFPALKFHGVRKFSQMQFRNRKSRIIHHTTVRKSSTSMIQHATSFHFTLSLSCPCSFCSIRSQFLSRRCHIIWIVEDCRGSSFLSSWSFPTTFPEVPIICRVSWGNPESRRGMVGTQKSRGLIGNVGRSGVAPWFRIVKFCRIWQGIYFVLWFLNLSQQLTHSRRILVLMNCLCINSYLSCSICFLNSSVSWQSLAWFSWKSLFLNSISPNKLILPLWTWPAHRFACCSWNRWDFELLIDLIKRDIRISVFPLSCFHFSLSFLLFLLSHFLSSDGHFSFPLKDFVKIFAVS